MTIKAHPRPLERFDASRRHHTANVAVVVIGFPGCWSRAPCELCNLRCLRLFWLFYCAFAREESTRKTVKVKSSAVIECRECDRHDPDDRCFFRIYSFAQTSTVLWSYICIMHEVHGMRPRVSAARLHRDEELERDRRNPKTDRLASGQSRGIS